MWINLIQIISQKTWIDNCWRNDQIETLNWKLKTTYLQLTARLGQQAPSILYYSKWKTK